MRSPDHPHSLMIAEFLPTLSPEEREFADAYDLYQDGWKERVPAGLAPQAIAYYLKHKANEYMHNQFNNPDSNSEGWEPTRVRMKKR